MIPLSFFQKFNYYLPETIIYRDGVVAAGGTLQDIDYLDTKFRAWQLDGSFSNLLWWTDGNLGLIKDGSNGISRMFNAVNYTQYANQNDAGAWPLYTANGRVSGKASTGFNSDYLTLNINTLLAGLNTFTIESWIKMTSINTNNSPWFSDNGNESFPSGRFTSGAKLQFYSFKTAGALAPVNNLQSTTTFTTATYYHIALVRNGTTNKFFLNGTEESSQASVLTETSSANSQIGGFPGGSAGNFIGNIDNFRIWNTARTGAQLIAHAD